LLTRNMQPIQQYPLREPLVTNRAVTASMFLCRELANFETGGVMGVAAESAWLDSTVSGSPTVELRDKPQY